jgi:hypothetical protein
MLTVTSVKFIAQRKLDDPANAAYILRPCIQGASDRRYRRLAAKTGLAVRSVGGLYSRHVELSLRSIIGSAVVRVGLSPSPSTPVLDAGAALVARTVIARLLSRGRSSELDVSHIAEDSHRFDPPLAELLANQRDRLGLTMVRAQLVEQLL